MTRLNSPVTIWIILMILSAASLLVAEDVHPPHIAVVAIFAVAMIKAHLVMIHFMEVNHAAPHWRALYQIWIVVAGAALVIGNVIG